MDTTLPHLLELSRQALAEAKANEWEKALQIQQHRNVLLREVFAENQAIAEAIPAEQLADDIRQMLDCDEQLKQLIETQRPVLIDGFQQFQKKRQNIGEYMNHRPM